MGLLVAGAALLAAALLFYVYVRVNDAKIMDLPPDVASAFSAKRITPEEAREVAGRIQTSPHSVDTVLPPRTGRRYIVLGGSGFLGGWIVRHLVERGEDPRRIRVLDIRAPTRPDLTTGRAKDVDFRLVDVSDKEAVRAAFKAPWPAGEDAEITVFHTVANIRFYERHPRLLPLSDKVNVQGTQNVVDAAREIGVSVLVYTSSGSISVRRTRFWLWPWQAQPEFFVQVFKDDAQIPQRHEDAFSNYAVSKAKGEKIVRGVDNTPSGGGVLRTGCVRPGNGIYGPGGDILAGAYLVRQTNPTWIGNILHNFIYVENASLAHLLYERRLLDTLQGSSNPDIGGQAFAVCDAGAPVTYGDVYTTLSTLTDGLATFPRMSATGMLLLSHIFELQHLARMLPLLSASRFLRALGRRVPALNGDLVNLQPSMFALTMVHLVWDDSRARAPPEKGGLGYVPQWTTLEGLCKLVDEHKKAGGRGEERSLGGGVSFGFKSTEAGRGVKRVINGLTPDAVSLKLN
ncbi:NAD-P-binding protein [Auriscalpium vulgare]|uniref:NAD-P-binding protein n=1 Tax=Auriscalpium vulgare TaxID=40419 RepID=A0ACB8RUA4_9AGAM|nr:NAD-P-binding protein [Auriscalpium vulgare]